MDRKEYEFAHLDDEQVGEIKELEQQWTARTGHPVTLIAYEQKEAE